MKVSSSSPTWATHQDLDSKPQAERALVSSAALPLVRTRNQERRAFTTAPRAFLWLSPWMGIVGLMVQASGGILQSPQFRCVPSSYHLPSEGIQMTQSLWRSNPGLQTPSSGPSSHHKHWTRGQQAWTWVSASRRVHSMLRINKHHLSKNIGVPGLRSAPPPDLPSHNAQREEGRAVCG